MNSTDRQVQILKNQQVILLALEEIRGGYNYGAIVGDLAKECIEDTNNLLALKAEGE